MRIAASPLAAFHPSNALTHASLTAGIAAVVCARQGNGSGAGALIALAVICDSFDGLFARSFARTPESRRLGAHLDSLSDAVVFGTSPIACAWLLSDAGWGLLCGGALYTVCAVARLAYYNVTHDTHDGFVGLPAPLAALIWSTALLMNPGVSVMAGLTVVTAAAMVLPLHIPRPRRAGLIAFACWPAVVCVAHTLRIP